MLAENVIDINAPRRPPIRHNQVSKMSALQTFMLVADQDKEEAFRIAESTAKGVCVCERET